VASDGTGPATDPADVPTADAAAVRRPSAPDSSSAGARVRRASASTAAPRATTCLGCAPTTVGRPKASDTIRATSGMREEPPTSSTADSWSGATRAARSTRSRVPIVDSIGARIMPSSWSRVRVTSTCRLGRNTGMVVSTSTDSASLASVQSCRSRASAITVVGSLWSSSVSAPPAT
jgi:hypothetical protein